MKKHLLKFGVLIILTISLMGCGQNTPSTVDEPSITGKPAVKKSINSICHEKGSTYYNKTKNFIPYDSIDECLDSGGRLPKR